ncbi:MAG: AAA family ATPase, partial [Desulfohalobiaceae bacterium]|nr:AAA family ATPase [Desulfohalobiaceae bacterium]
RPVQQVRPVRDRLEMKPHNARAFQRYLDHEARSRPETADDGQEQDLMLEIRQMKESFEGLVQQFAQSKDRLRGHWPTLSPELPGRNFDTGPIGKHLLVELQDCGLKSRTLQEFAERMKHEEALSEMPEDTDGFLERFIAETVRLDNPLAGGWTAQKRLAFIGPTGVGKTTTIAKIAANCLLELGKSVALVTIDNYRIAAVEQLKIYGQIMNVPVEPARSPEELKAILARHEDKDLILLDTAGRSPSDELSQEELAGFLDPALNIDNHLVLAATTRERDLQMVINTFGRLQLKGLVFTKLDESQDLGAVLNLPVATGYPVSFLSNGQKVPEDLLLPEPGQLAAMTLKKKEGTEEWNIVGNRIRPEHSVQ